jgi:glutamate-1-semialdehyde 2,1-aminomutase
LFHGGVYSGNALVMAAADAVLDEMLENRDGIYRHLEDVSTELADGVVEIFSRLGIPHHVHQVGPMMSILLTRGDCGPITNYRDVRRHCDFEKFITLQHQLQQTGVYFHPNQFEPFFLSTAHTQQDVAIVLERLEDGARAVLLS